MARSALRKIQADLECAVNLSERLSVQTPAGEVIRRGPRSATGAAADVTEAHEELVEWDGSPVCTIKGPRPEVSAVAMHVMRRLREVEATRDLQHELLRSYQQILWFEQFAIEISRQDRVAQACLVLVESARVLVDGSRSTLFVRIGGGPSPRVIVFDESGDAQQVEGEIPVPDQLWDGRDGPVAINSGLIAVPLMVGATRPAVLLVERTGQRVWSAADINILAALGQLGTSIIPGVASRVSQQRLVTARRVQESRTICDAVRACANITRESTTPTLDLILMRPPRNLDLYLDAVVQGEQLRLLFLEAIFDARLRAVLLEDGGVVGVTLDRGDVAMTRASNVITCFVASCEASGLDLAPGGLAILEDVPVSIATLNADAVWNQLDEMQRTLADGAINIKSFREPWNVGAQPT